MEKILISNRNHKSGFRNQTLTDSVVEILREKILSSEVQGGSPLRQDALADELGVSRIPIREALLQLEGDGLVRFIAHKGAIVTDISIKEIEELFHLRAILECDILSQAIDHILEDHLTAADKIVSQFKVLLKRGADLKDWGKLNWAFHRQLYCAAERPRALSIIEKLHTNCDRYLRLQQHLSGGSERAVREHRELVRLCRKRDKRAAKQLLNKHIINTGNDLVEHLPR